jgi:hypothetical protein
MTENEAKAKWCPFVTRATGSGSEQGGNRGADGKFNSGTSNCIASACMCWEFETATSGDCGLVSSRVGPR